jgi:hypothetical protein
LQTEFVCDIEILARFAKIRPNSLNSDFRKHNVRPPRPSNRAGEYPDLINRGLWRAYHHMDGYLTQTCTEKDARLLSYDRGTRRQQPTAGFECDLQLGGHDLQL